MYFYPFRPEINLFQLWLVGVVERQLDCGSQDSWTLILILPLPGYITLGKSLSFSVSLFLCTGVDICLVQLMGLLGGSNENVSVKLLGKDQSIFIGFWGRQTNT